MDQKKGEDLIRRLAAALRSTELYSPTHPLVQRGIDALTAAATEALHAVPSIVVRCAALRGCEMNYRVHRTSLRANSAPCRKFAAACISDR